ncbi:uncharacterized protein E0L32_001271 [Thyridium curvatum]|uniref:ATPase AAA-type core domain-containing protein n=1 Tax=Thyridium curvatum TaxID=1093900 RepID=A0A507AUA5_9PEZI|nr:uncharacterized protein E0L32_001271 [Thyridium curvatum]TPX10074.1 hypothetical protein E0L32_001271 [Thyridium curvatum]
MSLPTSFYPAPKASDEVTRQFFEHSSAPRINTDAVIVQALTQQYPNLQLSVVPRLSSDLLSYAAAGHASFRFLGPDSSDELPSSLQWTVFLPPARRLDGDAGVVAEKLVYGKMAYKWEGHDFIVYLVDGRDGSASYPSIANFYVLSADKQQTEAMILQVGKWTNELHDEVWVFDGGYWQKSQDLYNSVRNASWDNVILDPDMKKAIIEDHLTFFESRDTYEGLKVPWKRGIIYYGPPGNGKTVSVKVLSSFLIGEMQRGPEYSINQIFLKARQFAPCYLVFEDLDTIVSDNVRSYFLNEVDGLKSNDGIFMIGSTNHLDRLDPGISKLLQKRPSRFDRKYFFPDPNLKERTAYCHFWQRKLSDNKDIDFPDKLCTAIAEITVDFSFAYMQEAFVASLLAIAGRSHGVGKSGGGKEVVTEELEDDWVGVRGDKDLDELVLWVEIQKQIRILREGMDKSGIKIGEVETVDR